MILLWTASRSTLVEPGGPDWLARLAERRILHNEETADREETTLVTGDAASDDVAWRVAERKDLERLRYRKDGAVEGPDGFVRWWLPGAPRPLPTDREGWRQRLLARDAWMAHDCARLARERGGRAVCLAAVDPHSKTQGAAFTATHAKGRGLVVEAHWFRRNPGPLRVRTARVSYAGEDRFDVTRSGADAEGLHFAPSDMLLWPAKRGLAAADELARAGDEAAAEAARADVWARYAPRYREEMRASYKRNRAAWERLLGRGSVRLVCFCTSSGRCHRSLLAELLVKCGAVYEGEVGAAGGTVRASSRAGGSR